MPGIRFFAPALLCLAIIHPSTASARPPGRPALGFHIVTPTAKTICDNAIPADFQVVDHTDAPDCVGGTFPVFILVCGGSDSLGVAGMEFGIDYDGLPSSGVDVTGFTLCADQLFAEPSWPDAGTGAIITWDRFANCQNTNTEPFVPNTVSAVGGVLTVTAYSPDRIRMTPRPITGIAAIGTCFLGEIPLQDDPEFEWAGAVGFCTYGFNACAVGLPVEDATWSRIKGRYRN